MEGKMSKRTRSKTKNPNPTRARRARLRWIRRRALNGTCSYLADFQKIYQAPAQTPRDAIRARTTSFRGVLPHIQGRIMRKPDKRTQELYRREWRQRTQFGAQHG